MDALMTVLNHPGLPSSFIMGSVIHWSAVIRYTKGMEKDYAKWALPWYMYSNERFPNYVNGPGYLVSRSVVPCLLQGELWKKSPDF